jgi:hypothetical protein
MTLPSPLPNPPHRSPRVARALAPVLLLLPCLAAAAPRPTPITVLDRPNTSTPNSLYIGNRPPLTPSPLIKLPIGSVRPAGWTHRMLRLQADGFHGHLAEISDFLKTADNAWLDPSGKGQRGWEEPPYWLKGFQDCAALLQDPRMLQESRVWIEAALNSQQPDGWFGPGEERTGVATNLRGREDLWPNMIMLFCLQSFHEQTNDRRVLDLMTAYFRYLLSVPEERFLVGYWPKMRAGDQLHSIYWLYNRTGDDWLLDLAHKTHRHAARWDHGVINWHNVNMAQGFREPATYFQQTRNPQLLDATYRNWALMRELYGQVPGGMFGSDENCRPGYVGPRQAIETCGIAEEMLSNQLLLGITGDPVWADRCEDVAFNSLPASMTADLKALRYLTAPNQPQSDHVSKAPGIQNGGPMFCMDPHDHRCCQHNAGHAWPYFVQHLWYATPDNGLAALLYAPAHVHARVGPNTAIHIHQSTQYPFSDNVSLLLNPSHPVEFPLHLRIPAWCTQPQIRLNGRRLRFDARPLSFVRITRTWQPGDRLELRLPMTIRLQTWTTNHNTVSVQHGPLTYSLQIAERYVRHGGTDTWPAWDIFPDSPWNYALALPQRNPTSAFKVVRRPWPADDQPFHAVHSPIQLRARGKRIPEWTLDSRGLIHEVQPSPVRSSQPTTEITLIPMGAARLRISAFPVAGAGPDAHTWTAPIPSPITASHCHENDSPEAVADGRVPRSSSDHSIPRFTWWPRRGSSEWIQQTLSPPRTVSAVEVYWFDDTGTGQCRLPASWRVLHRQQDQWIPVEPHHPYPTELNAFNSVRFDPVTTDSLRLEVQLQTGFSGGILEWRVPR